MEVYREILPESYLLILIDDAPAATDAEVVLRKAFKRAAHSGKTSVWIDCSNLQYLSATAAAVLGRYGTKLSRRGISLLLCHLSEPICQELLSRQPDLSALVVPTLLDAQQYCRQRVNRAWQRLAG